MYWPCQRGYLFGEVVEHAPGMPEVRGFEATCRGAVSHCHISDNALTTSDWDVMRQLNKQHSLDTIIFPMHVS